MRGAIDRIDQVRGRSTGQGVIAGQVEAAGEKAELRKVTCHGRRTDVAHLGVQFDLRRLLIGIDLTLESNAAIVEADFLSLQLHDTITAKQGELQRGEGEACCCQAVKLVLTAEIDISDEVKGQFSFFCRNRRGIVSF